MAGNSFGHCFRLTTFGESHGTAIGGVIDGCPAGLVIDFEAISIEMMRRRPGRSAFSSPRMEEDQVEFLSGIFEGTTTGSPIGFLVRNIDQRPRDYSELKDVYRPSHADFVFEKKYGFRDYRGGGRASARETVSRVVGGAVAKQILAKEGIAIRAYVHAIGGVEMEANMRNYDASDFENELRCPDKDAAAKMGEALQKAMDEGDTLGGVIACVVEGVPVGLGEPVFDKLHADLAKAMLSINAVKGFEIGSGFAAARMKGSQHNDIFVAKDGDIRTLTNYSGGVQGGISNGMDIKFRTAFKPVSSIKQKQETVDLANKKVSIEIQGRHDPCVVPRAVPIVEAMTALVLVDHLLRNKLSKI